MPRQHLIKWRERDEKELRRVARNFNDKLRRLAKKNPENKNLLPHFYNESTDEFEARITVSTLKNMIKTRNDYNRNLNMLKRFLRRGAETIVDAPANEYGTRTTRWQKQEAGRLAGIVNRKRQERLERLNLIEMISASGKLGYTIGEMFGMGYASKNKLTPTRSFTPSQSQADLRYKLRALLKESSSNYYRDKDEILKDNYINTILENYHRADVKGIIKNIRSMDNDMFVNKFEARGDKFELAYPPARGSEEYNAYLEELINFW